MLQHSENKIYIYIYIGILLYSYNDYIYIHFLNQEVCIRNKTKNYSLFFLFCFIYLSLFTPFFVLHAIYSVERQSKKEQMKNQQSFFKPAF